MPAIHGLLEQFKKLDTSYSLYTPSPTERGETAVLTAINSYIKAHGKPIDVKIGTVVLKNIYGANKISGTPKADIALVTYNKTSKKFEEVFYISHKMGSTAKDYQQYSGTSEKADGSVAGSISKHKEVIKFLKDISKFHGHITKKKFKYYSKIKDTNLIGKSVFGPQFGSPTKGPDNIDIIAQGTPTFTKSGSTYTLTFSAGVSFNPDVSHFTQNGYRAVLVARYTSGRNYTVGGKTYADVRVLIMPEAYVSGKSSDIYEI